jgi:putative membrane-bound dehydrogenase-like protein
MKPTVFSIALAVLWLQAASTSRAEPLRIEADEAASTISVFRAGAQEPILTQNARADFRPYLHPIVAPDGQGLLTEYSPAHHKHQTGLYWGFTRVNGRDYFHHPGEGYWRRVSATILPTERSTPEGGEAEPPQDEGVVRWQTIYDLLDEQGETMMQETQTWSMHQRKGEYLLDLEWAGEARTDVTISEYNYGGLFLRMPWRPGIAGDAVNAARQRNERAEGQKSPWLDVGMQVEGREDLAHIAIFDHPENAGFPQPWRVDKELGVGPVRARLGDWHIKKGEREVIRHRLFFYTGNFNDRAVTKRCDEYAGKNRSTYYALKYMARAEAKVSQFLTPENAVAAMTLVEGFAANVYACEPMITQPMAFCWDDRGRLWIAENRDYENRRAGFANSGDSRIVILSDAGRDGRADERKVFAEGIPFPAAIAVGFGGLWLGAPPNLLFVPDRDGDDRADSDNIEVRLTGWGIRDRHETLNSFRWGPDGWLYGCQGFATRSTVGKPIGEGRLFTHKDPFPEDLDIVDPVDFNGGIWRYHPTKDRFEVIAHGFSNPWGLDFDAKGQLFITACVIPHLWHVVPGGFYHRQGGTHFNPYLYGGIQTIADHMHRQAHGGARIYLSDAFPREYYGQIFMGNIHEHSLLTDVLERKGSGFVGHHGDDFLLANNAQWIGFSVEVGPDGGVYVLDWHDADICGNAVRHKETGRVFRIMPRESQAESWDGRYGDLAKRSNAELVALQRSESDWHARRARLILQARSQKGAVGPDTLDAATQDALREIFAKPSPWRLRALWALHVTGGLEEADLLSALADGDEYIRAWSIQLLCEDLDPSSQALEKFASMARSDSSAVVRLYLAAALQRLELEKRWAIATPLVAHVEDVTDHNIPRMLWFAIEPLVPEDPRRAVELAAGSRIPMLSRYIARRLVDADQMETVITAIDTRPALRPVFLSGLRDALDGRFDVAAPQSWTATYPKLQAASEGEVASLALEVAQQLGEATAVQTGLRTLSDDEATAQDRRRALRVLSTRSPPELLPRLLKLLDNPSLRRDAIRAMAAFDDRRLTKALLDAYAQFSTEERLDAVHTLASRSPSGRELASAIKNGHVPRRDVPPYVARQLRRVVGSGFVEIWGPIDAVSQEKVAEFAKYRALLTAQNLDSANVQRGQAVFQKTCGGCHKMYGEGGPIGPELTGSNRTDINYLLANILTPSEVIQDAYKMTLVLTASGRLYTGILARESERYIELRVVGEEKPAVLSKSSIFSREVAPVSMMPEGLLRELTDAEVLDLFEYLRRTQ